MTPKERTTEYLDLRALGESSSPEEIKEQDAQLRRLTKALRGKRKIVVIAGAGISVSAGSKQSLQNKLGDFTNH